MSEKLAVQFSDIQNAAKVLSGVAHRTPVMTSRTLDERAGASVFLKCENFQRMGAFKFRGAYNALSRLSAEEKKAGVLAWSSGNHAQAVALSGRLLKIPVVIVMPDDAPRVKLEATRGYRAEVVLYRQGVDKREEVGDGLARERGLTIIPPFNHPHIIAGQGTAALELFEDAGALDFLFVPIGGGGLGSGCGVAARSMSPGCQVIGVEPEAGDDAQRSLRAGSIQKISTPKTIADGARTESIGSLTFPLLREYLSDIYTASDSELLSAMGFMLERMKIVVEPTGVLGLAGALKSAELIRGKRVGVVLSGGNVDLGAFGLKLG